MRVSDLVRLYDYNYWANKHLFSAISQLTPEQFTQSVAGSYGSIRNTMVHTMSAEWGWLERCGGAKRGDKLNPDNYPTVASLVHAWSRVEANVRTFLAGLTDEDLVREVEFVLGDGPTHHRTVGQLMQHAANHGVHHRGQAALLLRVLGHSPGNFDLLFFPDGAQP